MKKMTKFMSLLLCVAMVLTMVACGNTQGTNPTTNGTVPTTKPAGTGESKGNYTVIVKTAGGMALANVDIEIRTGDDLVNVGRTNADGTYTANLPTGKEYSVKLNNVPAGYEIRDSYAFNGSSCVISLGSSLITGQEITSGTRFELGSIMYDFQFTDSDGVVHTLSETLAEKKMVMLNFWYTNCSYCYQEFPAINTVYAEYADEIEIFALNDYPGENMDGVLDWKNSLGLNFPMGLITTGLGIGSFGGGGWPMTVIIDRYGMIAMAHAGAITSEHAWKQIFGHFTAENYQQKLIVEYTDLVNQVLPTETFPGSDAIGNAINKGELNVTYRPDDNEYVWPFVETTFNGQTCVKASNSRIDSSYSILYADVELKAGQAFGFDYIISSELGNDYVVIIVNGEDIYQVSGYDETPQWKTCYPWVALEDGVYEVAICYIKDGSTNAGDDTIYIDNARVVNVEDIEVDTYIPRQAAVKQENGKYEYVELVYNQKDGYYHVGSANGPLLLANLMGYTQFCEDDFIYNMAIAGDIVYQGKDYYADLTPFASYATNASLPGYCTVTQELYEILQIIDEIKGFDRNDNREWLKICEYYQSYGPTGTQLEDPIKGLAPFSAPEAVLGTWQLNETTGEWEFTAENGEEGELNYFFYDRAIMPRGLFYKFTPAKSGVYRITSHTTSTVGLDGWIFSEEGFYNREVLYTFSGDERFYDDPNNISMVYYMEAGVSYYIDIAFWSIYDTGYIPFDVTFLGESYDLFRLASRGTFSYAEDTEFIVSGGIEVYLGEDNIYYHWLTDENGVKMVDENGKPVLGSKLYADFSSITPIFSDPIMDVPVLDKDGNPVLDDQGNPLVRKGIISKGGFDFSKNEYDQEIVTYLRNHNNDVEATKDYLRTLWGADYETYAEIYKLEEIFRGEYHGEGEDLTPAISAFLSQVITDGSVNDGCVVVTKDLADLLQALMDKFTFEGVENSWRKLCYYYDHLGQ